MINKGTIIALGVACSVNFLLTLFILVATPSTYANQGQIQELKEMLSTKKCKP